MNPNSFDRYITGDRGEDREEQDPPLLAALFEQNPAPWSMDDNRDGHEGLVTVFDANGDYVLCTGSMEDCSGGDIELARAIAALPDLLALAQKVAQDYPDAADWKDARAVLSGMAAGVLLKVRER